MGAAERSVVRPLIDAMEGQLQLTEFLAGPRFSAADITAFFGYSALQAFGAIPTDPPPAVQRWLALVGPRPAFAPIRALAAAVPAA